MTETTDDRFLGGRVFVRQFNHGFRAGLDAVMLAAAVPAQSRDETFELGSGAGTASLCLAERVRDVSGIGVEVDPVLASLANENAAANERGDRVKFVEADIFALPTELKRDFAHVFCNPPFHDEQGEVSPEPSRDRALRDVGQFTDWIATGLKRTISGGTFTVILRADRLGEALAQMPERGVTIFPLWPRAGEPAKRVILQARKGSRAASTLSPGHVLHNADGTYTAEADAILRDGASLALDSRGL
ncbi:MAG TPA: methyltransferase [Rhizomicrobium sp.]|nr:methyltransferase [Rhizomicrobium sp.]